MTDELGTRPPKVLVLIIVGALLSTGGSLGMCYVGGFSAVWSHLSHVNYPWLLLSLAGVAISWAGYYIAFEGLARIPGGPDLSARERVAVVAAGFGSFLYKGGAVVDSFAMKRGGADERVANVRVSTLKSLEHAPIAGGTCVASIFLLALGRTDPPPLDFMWPWAIGPVLGGAITILLAAHFHVRLRDKRGRFLEGLGVALDGIWMFRELAFGGKSHGTPFFGMAIFWAADIFALWAALEAFSGGISFAGIVVGYAVGYVLTRRSAPLGGAGLIDVVLAPALWACGASFAGAVAAVIVYRFFSVWIPLPAAIAALPTVRRIEAGPANSRPALAH